LSSNPSPTGGKKIYTCSSPSEEERKGGRRKKRPNRGKNFKK
jgi:hypothetical protein